MPVTPEQAAAILGQTPGTTPNLMPVPNSAPVTPAPTAIPTSTPGAPTSVQALSGNPTPQPVRFGHFQKALIDGANEAASSDPNASAPGAWARHILAGASKALSGGVTAIGDVSTKPGGGAIAGIAETLANRNNRLQQQKEYSDKQAQLVKENQRADAQLAMEQQKADDLHAYTTVQTVNLQKSAAKLDEEAQQTHIKDGKAAAEMFAKHHTPLETGVPESQLMAGMTKGGKYDPNDTRGFQTGTREVTVGGKLVPENTYDVFKRSSEPVEVDAPNAALLDKYGSVKFPAGSKVDGDLLDSAITSAQAAKTSAFLINKANDEMEQEQLNADQIKQHSKDLTTVNPFLASDEDPITALEKMQSHKDKNGKPTEEAGAASRLLMRYDPKVLEDHRKDLAEEKIKQQEADFKKSAENKFVGDTTKIGQYDQTGVNKDYLSSLKPDERALVMAAGSGQLGIERWDYLLSHTPEFAAAVANTFKGFDSSKIKDYIAVSKDFTQGGTFNSLNSAGAMAQHLKDLYDLSTLKAQLGQFTEVGKRRQAVVGQLAPESIKFFSGTKAKPGEQETKAEAEKYDAAINRRAYIEQKAENAVKKLQEFKQSWANAAPSQVYEAQMPWISPQAQHDLAYILNGGKEPSAEQIAALGPDTLPPGGLNQQNAPAFRQPGPNWNGGSHVQPSSAQPEVGEPGEVPPQLTPDEIAQLSPDEKAEYEAQQQQPSPFQQAISANIPANLPSDTGTVQDKQGNWYSVDRATNTLKRIASPIPAEQVTNLAAAAKQAAIDAQHRLQTHGTGR